MSVIGTDLKIKIHVEPIGNMSLSKCDFKCTFFVGDKSVTLQKSQMKSLDSNTYVALVDSNDLSIGTVNMTIEIEVPDEDFEDKTRTEIETICTGITIRKRDTY